MCGIFVAFNYQDRGVAAADLRDATSLVSHRGPDNIGHFDDGRCFLGHTRLSIVGLGSGSDQPFQFDHLVMTYNGEVYNYIEIREELISCGYTFETTSDTEVVLKAFHKWGGACFAKFNGMWALAIYDTKSGKLIASRDRFGQKPMFALRDGQTIYLASELQQLVKLSGGTIDYGLIQMFLKEGTYEGEGRTFIRGVDEFPKAHYFEFGATGEPNGMRYWDYWDGKIGKVDDACLSEFSQLLQDAVKLRMRADVPFGVLLSGGIDSTVVAAFARQFAGDGTSIPAYTYAASEAAEDESAYAATVANRLALTLTVRKQDRDPADYRGRLKQLVKHMGRGHSSPAIVSVDYLYESVAESGMKLALDGQGADELLAGYKTYFPLAIPLFLLKGRLSQAVDCFRDACGFGLASAGILFLRNVLPAPARAALRRLYGYERFFRLYRDEPRASRLKAVGTAAKNKSIFNRYLIKQHNIGLTNLLFYGDVVAMKNSVENRSPFMDYRLVDFVFSKGDRLKLQGGANKYALRALPVYDAFRDVLDRKKIGFSSDARTDTKLAMIRELKTSPILAWPIFTKSLAAFVKGTGFEDKKYERLLFRFYQVHLWNEVLQEMKDASTTAGIVPRMKSAPVPTRMASGSADAYVSVTSD